MPVKLLMGNEALGLGAMHAGVNFVSGYPGTPSTEVLETIAKHNDGSIHVEWSTNEKAALEAAAGAAYAGARALVTMKQVGLNVASDPLMTLSYIGVEGGLVIVVADDPGPISSQTEQDTRNFAQFAKVPIFAPASPGEAYGMIQDAFELSERHHTPVIVRPTTRVIAFCVDSAAKRSINPARSCVQASTTMLASTVCGSSASQSMSSSRKREVGSCSFLISRMVFLSAAPLQYGARKPSNERAILNEMRY